MKKDNGKRIADTYQISTTADDDPELLENIVLPCLTHGQVTSKTIMQKPPLRWSQSVVEHESGSKLTPSKRRLRRTQTETSKITVKRESSVKQWYSTKQLPASANTVVSPIDHRRQQHELMNLRRQQSAVIGFGVGPSKLEHITTITETLEKVA